MYLRVAGFIPAAGIACMYAGIKNRNQWNKMVIRWYAIFFIHKGGKQIGQILI
jgi:hypothetical protein